jgi:hypothetical protein
MAHRVGSQFQPKTEADIVSIPLVSRPASTRRLYILYIETAFAMTRPSAASMRAKEPSTLQLRPRQQARARSSRGAP